LRELKEVIKQRDFNKDDPKSFTGIIVDIKDLRQGLEKIELELSDLGQKTRFLKNKIGGGDIEARVNKFAEDNE
jgi:hypothetical protein